MINNNLYNKVYALAVKVVELSKYISTEKREFVLSKQFLRSGTSIGANVAEANGGISKADFSAKISIAYKECKETQYWISLLKDPQYISISQFNNINNDLDEIGRILFSILKTTRIDNQ